jgi:uncharacterized damage-inducible protein DinB
VAIKESLLPEWDHEMGTTRRLLERVPAADFAFRPHDKSGSLGELAAHVAYLPRWCTLILDNSVLELASVADERGSREPESVEALLKAFDRKSSAARANLAQRLDPELLAPWTLEKEGHEVFTLPRISAIRSFVLNHTIHHRGQLSVYLRLRNVPLPPIYGPTADEG